MVKRSIFILVLVSMLSAVSIADTYFTDQVGNHLWSDPCNWDNGVPDINTPAYVDLDFVNDSNYCLIDGAVKEANNLKLGRNGYKNAKCVMNEGTLTLGVNLDVAWVVNSDGAVFEMNGGFIDIGNKLHIGRHPTKTSVNPEAQFYFNNGVIEATNIVIGDDPNTVLEMSENAVLKLRYETAGYDKYYTLQGYVADEKIVPTRDPNRITWYLYTPDNSNNPYYPDDVTVLYYVYEPNRAWDPSPENIATGIPADTTQLAWQSGDSMEEEKLYFGTDQAAVEAGDASVDKGTVSSPYTLPSALQLGETYYWRIETINNTTSETWPGDVWSFTVVDSIVVDDFDSYADSTDLWNYWIDGYTNGTGSWVELRKSTSSTYVDYIHDGNAMELKYDNTTSGSTSYSEISRTFTNAQDWQSSGTECLSIILHGAEDNNEAPVYVILEDNSGNTGQVNYAEPSELIQESWQEFIEWNIDLGKFADQGVNLQQVKTIYIGVGDRDTATGVASGFIYIDDINLYVPRYVDSKFPANLNGDQAIDFTDLGFYALSWLEEGFTVTASQPSDSNLVVHYEFEDTTGKIVTDSSGNNFDGVTTDTYNHYDSAGVIGGCLDFGGVTGVSVPAADVFNVNALEDQITISVWVKAEEDYYPQGDYWSDHWAILFQGGKWASQGTQYRYLMGYAPTAVMYNNNPDIRNATILFRTSPDGTIPSADNVAYSYAEPEDWGDGQWVHFAFVKNAAENTMGIYKNGVLIASRGNADTQLNLDALKTQGFCIGQIVPGAWYYHGKMDDFRIYDRALSQAEIVDLAGETSVYQHLLTEADFDNSDKVDFLDFDELAESWSDELLWP